MLLSSDREGHPLLAFMAVRVIHFCHFSACGSLFSDRVGHPFLAYLTVRVLWLDGRCLRAGLDYPLLVP